MEEHWKSGQYMSKGSVPGKVTFESLTETLMSIFFVCIWTEKYYFLLSLFGRTNVASALPFFPLNVPSGPLSIILFFPPSPLQLEAIVQQCRFWTGQPMIDIFRPTQPLDGRVVYRSKASAALTGAIHLWFGVLSVVLATMGLMHWLGKWKHPIYVTKATVFIKVTFVCVIVKHQTVNYVYGYSQNVNCICT